MGNFVKQIQFGFRKKKRKQKQRNFFSDYWRIRRNCDANSVMDYLSKTARHKSWLTTKLILFSLLFSPISLDFPIFYETSGYSSNTWIIRDLNKFEQSFYKSILTFPITCRKILQQRCSEKHLCDENLIKVNFENL